MMKNIFQFHERVGPRSRLSWFGHFRATSCLLTLKHQSLLVSAFPAGVFSRARLSFLWEGKKYELP